MSIMPERLRAGARTGRLPVAPLAEQAVTWAEGVLADPGASPVLAPRPPQGWQATAAWEKQRRVAAEEVVHPALSRWVRWDTEVVAFHEAVPGHHLQLSPPAVAH